MLTKVEKQALAKLNPDQLETLLSKPSTTKELSIAEQQYIKNLIDFKKHFNKKQETHRSRKKKK